MIELTLIEAARMLDGTLLGADRPFCGVGTDTRKTLAGRLFFALRGPNFDAHEMLDQAAEAGAAGAVVDRDVDTAALARIRVADTRRALGRLANAWRRRHTLPVIAITGSSGKTTVKEMTASILRRSRNTLATQGNLNNDIGVPLTLFELGPEHRAAVIEMGANRVHDIAELCRIAEPDIGVVTLCAPAHLEGFGDLESVARTKGEIIENLPPDGIAVFNADDDFAPLWAAFAGQRRALGFGEHGVVRASKVRRDEDGMRFELLLDGASHAVRIAFAGRHNVNNALAAAAAAHAAGCPLEDIVAGLEAARPVGGRLRFIELAHGHRLIDDTYNANPASLAAALEVLAGERNEKWLVFGDMGELGDDAPRYHAEVGRAARARGVSRVYALGELATEAGQAFGAGARHFDDRERLSAALVEALDAQASAVTVLFKGSRVMGMERVIATVQASGAD